jgi:thiol:disulfide interchange protein DsbD
MKTSTLCTAFAVSLALPVPGQVQAKPAPVKMHLVSEVDAVVPGIKLTIGLFLKHGPGWHSYWKNPGTVGMATRVKWKLPKGCTAGPLRWQLPQRTKMGVYTVWGYEGEALLLTDISVPKKLAGKGDLEFTADVSYMVCSKTCNPGNEKVSIVLPRRDKAKVIANWRARFEKIRGQQPRKMERTWYVAATRSAETYTLTLTPNAKGGANGQVRDLYFFAEAEGRLISSDAPQKFRRVGNRLVLHLQREKFSPGEGKRLRGLLHSVDGFLDGATVNALAVDAPITTAEKKRPAPR